MRTAMVLPANDEIYLEASVHRWGVWVCYRGPSLTALLNADCITQTVADKCKPSAARGGYMRTDEHGDQFSPKKRPLKSSPERIQIERFIKDAARARTLPGVAAYLDGLTTNTMQPRERVVGLGGNVRTKGRCGMSADNVVTFDASRQRLPRTLDRFERSAQTETFPVRIDGDVSLTTLLRGLLPAGLTVKVDANGRGFVITRK